MKKVVRIALLAVFLFPFANAQKRKPRLPDPALAPGIASDITTEEFCSRSFTTRDERHVTTAMKKQGYAEVQNHPWERTLLA